MFKTSPTADLTVRRKDDHLDLVLAGTGQATVTTGLEAVRFEHCALPELDLDAIDLGRDWLGKRLRAPFLIGSMTGGPTRATDINFHLAEAAEELGIAMAVGSQRVALQAGADFGLGPLLRRRTPSVPLLSNLGAAQLREAGGIELALRAADALEADALIIHLNPLQEALQPEGDRNWVGVAQALEALIRRSPVPVVAKEVGAGIGPRVARQLAGLGVAAIDVAGAGGTSWASIEAARARSAGERAVAAAFGGWGISTAEALTLVRGAVPELTLIGSGGIRDGIEAARAIRLGADLVGQAASTLKHALDSTEAVVEFYEAQIAQLRTVCFCTGSANLDALRQAPLLPAWRGPEATP